MSQYSDEEKQEYMSAIGAMLVIQPRITGKKIKEQLMKLPEPIDIGINEIHNFKKDIHKERSERYIDASEQKAVAEFEDFIQTLGPVLRSIAQKSRSDMARVVAIRALAENYEKVINLKMDIGIFKRQIGNITGQFAMLDVLKAIKQNEESGRSNADKYRRNDKQVEG